MVNERRSMRTARARGQRLADRARSRGLTLVELMVALAISLFMVAALVVLYVNNSSARVELDRSSRQIENGRFAVDMMRDDIALAGFYGELSQRELTTFVAGSGCEAAVAAMGWSAAAPFQAPAPVQGASGGTAIPAAWGCGALNQRAGTGYLIVRRLDPTPLAVAAAAAGTAHVQVNGCLDSGTPFRIASGPDAAAFTLTGVDCATVAPVRAYVSRLYYIADCGICGKDSIPTLKMRELQGNGFVDRVIADGIEDLQFEFGLDTDGDGLTNQLFVDFADLDAAALGPAASWGNVVSVRVRLISRATEPSPGYTDEKTYDRGALFAAYAAPAGATQFKRRSYTTLVQLPNVAGPREVP